MANPSTTGALNDRAKAHAKRDREAPRAPAGAKVSKPAVPPEQAPAAVSQRAPEAAPAAAAAPRADEQPLHDEGRGGSLVGDSGNGLARFSNYSGRCRHAGDEHQYRGRRIECGPNGRPERDQ